MQVLVDAHLRVAGCIILTFQLTATAAALRDVLFILSRNSVVLCKSMMFSEMSRCGNKK